jgi:hypothetical protein
MDLTKRNISTRVRPIMTVVIKRLRKPLSETKGKWLHNLLRPIKSRKILNNHEIRVVVLKRRKIDLPVQSISILP